MNKTFVAFVGVARSLVRSPRRRQARSVALLQASWLRATIMGPAITDQVAGVTTILAVANG
jgi:hypothetical protein